MIPLIIGSLVGVVATYLMFMGAGDSGRESGLDSPFSCQRRDKYLHPGWVAIATSILWGTVAYALASAIDWLALGGDFRVVPLIVGLALWISIATWASRSPW